MRSTRPSPSHTTGDTVARAKKTDRAAARRRYRAEMAGIDEEGADLDAEVTGSSTASTVRPAARTSPKFSSPPGRIGIREALRQSIHPVDLRGDLAALPWLVTHTKALWIPVLLTVGGGAAFLLAPGPITAYAFQFFVLAPAIGSIFIAGFLAPRASWLLGIIVGIVASLVWAVMLYSGGMNHALQTLGSTVQYAPADYAALVTQSALMSIPLGAFFAAAAAWYRRFLQLSNPNRGKRAAASSKKSGSDGRSRTAGTSKAR
jgi:hypothetical protein